MIILAITIFTAIAYVSLILAFTVGLKRVLSRRYDGFKENTKLSVIVPFRDEEANLYVLLDALSTQTLTQDLFELILVDDHSTDSSLLAAQVFSSKFQHFKLIASPTDSKGKKAALAYGISQALNPVIVFTDADCVPTKFWLEAISISASKGADFIIGAVVMSPVNSFARKLQSLEYSSLMATAAGSCGIGHPVIASSANLAFRNDLLKVDVKAMNPTIASGDDMFILHWAKKNGKCKIEFLNDERAIVQTFTESTIAKAFKQRKRWVSKSIHYKDFDTIVTGFIVLIFNLLLVVLLFASIFDVSYLFYFITLLFMKSLVDYPLINGYFKFTQQNALLKVFLPLQLVYPFYVVYSFISSLMIKVDWKRRTIK